MEWQGIVRWLEGDWLRNVCKEAQDVPIGQDIRIDIEREAERVRGGESFDGNQILGIWGGKEEEEE